MWAQARIPMDLMRLGARLSGDGPHEASQLAGDCSADDGCFPSAPAQSPIPGCQPSLSFPHKLPQSRGSLLHSVELLCPDPRRVSVGPGALDQHVPNAAIARLAMPPRLTASIVPAARGRDSP